MLSLQTTQFLFSAGNTFTNIDIGLWHYFQFPFSSLKTNLNYNQKSVYYMF